MSSEYRMNSENPTKVVILPVLITLTSTFVPLSKEHVPMPYSFGYKIKDKHGEQYRQEVGDGLHDVKGSYGFTDERGIHRHVNYVSDEKGFRAEVKTNEPGTAPLNPAGVKMMSSAHHYFGLPVLDTAKKGFSEEGKFGLQLVPIKDKSLAAIGSAPKGLGKKSIGEKELLQSEFAKQLLNSGGQLDFTGLDKKIALSPMNEKRFIKEGLGFSGGISVGHLTKEVGIPFVATEIFKDELKEKIPAFGATLSSGQLVDKSFAVDPLTAKEAMLKLKNIGLARKNFDLGTGVGLEKLHKSDLKLIPNISEKDLVFTHLLPLAEDMEKGLKYNKPNFESIEGYKY